MSFRMRHLVAPAVVASLVVHPAPAQSGAERAVVDSLFAELAAIPDSGAVPDQTRCAPYAGTLGRFCQQILAVARLERGPDASLAFDTEMAMRRVITEKPDWATAYFVLGIARLQLTRNGVLTREGPLQPLGVSAEAGAGHALVKALELEPTLQLAAEALALGPIPREGASQLANRREMLRRIRHTLPLSPQARMGIGIVERESGSADTAVVLFREAMAAGADTGIAHLEIARMLHKAGRPPEGRSALIAGAPFTHTANADARYREELSWIASPEELRAWDTLPVAERSRWLDAFWTDREVRDGRGKGERMIEHYRRYEEAMKEFRIVIPQKGRQRVRSVAMAGDVMVLEGGDATGRGGAGSRSGLLADGDAGASIEGSERNRSPVSDYLGTIGVATPFRDFGITQDVLDDRGVIWIRHGKPTERTQTSGGTAMEGWRYTRAPEPDLVLFFAETDFDGTSGASVLVPTPAGMGGLVINQLCGNQQGMCDELIRFSQPEGVMNSGTLDARGRMVAAGGRSAVPNQFQTRGATGADVIREAREIGRQQIVRGVTTDDFRPSFDALLQPMVQIYGLDRSGGGSPRLLVTFAIPGDKLVGTKPPAAGGRTVYPIRIRVMSTILGSPDRFDIDTTRNFAVATPLAAGQFLTATLELPVPPGTYRATVVITEGEGRGALSRLDAVTVPNSRGALTISSVVLGRQGSGATWHSGTTQVPLHPLNAFSRDGTAELYYQLGALRRGERYQTRVDFFEAGKEAEKAALSVAFTDEATAEWTEVQRRIGLENLDPGRYRVRVTVSGAGQAATETAFLTVVKPD